MDPVERKVDALKKDLESAYMRLLAAQKDATATAESSATLLAQNQHARADIRDMEEEIAELRSKLKSYQRAAQDEEQRASTAESKVKQLQATIRDLEDELHAEKKAHAATKRLLNP